MANQTKERGAKTLRALIFDVDGTLADTERDLHRVAFNQAFAATGITVFWDVDLYGQLLAVTGGKERLAHYFTKLRPDLKPAGNLEAAIRHLHAEKTAAFARLLTGTEVALRPGVRRLLKEARAAGLQLAIATTTTRENLAPILRALGDDGAQWFAVIAAGDVVARKKPAPDVYQYVLATLAVEPAEVIAFEDSENGLRAARAAGLPTVVTVTDYTRDQDFTGALVVVNHLGEPDQPLTPLGPADIGMPFINLAVLQALHRARG
ncbi:MAG: HAD-IA family hydrolase [Acidiferrobacter sp.]